MLTVYNLVMIDEDLSYDNHIEAFNIGFFSDSSIAEKIADKYLCEVNGFKDYHITYQITEKHIVGEIDDFNLFDIYIIYGWNENNNMDEIDVFESDCYSSFDAANAKLNELKLCFSRKEWSIDKYRIDECCWQEGFEREYH